LLKNLPILIEEGLYFKSYRMFGVAERVRWSNSIQHFPPECRNSCLNPSLWRSVRTAGFGFCNVLSHLFVSCFSSSCVFECSKIAYLSFAGNGLLKAAIPVTSLKVGDEVLLRIQGGARHTGIEIQEFIVENWIMWCDHTIHENPYCEAKQQLSYLHQHS